MAHAVFRKKDCGRVCAQYIVFTEEINEILTREPYRFGHEAVS